MTITGQSSLDKDDIDQMVKDAEAHAEEDRAAARGGRGPQQRRLARVPDREGAARSRATRSRPTRRTTSRPRSTTSRTRSTGTDIEAIKCGAPRP